MMALRAFVAGCVAILLVGCGGPVETTDNVLVANGPPSLLASRTPESLFVAAYIKAYDAQKSAYEKTETDTSSQAAYRNLTIAGFGLAKTYCSDFFRRKGENQKWLRFGSDIIAAGGALATGLLALTGSSALGVSIVALSTTTAYTSIDIYAKNFLFGAENIDSVRLLTLNALSDNARKAIETAESWDFQSATNAILNNQELCKPSSILRLTREAITAGAVQSTDNGTRAATVDTLVKEAIGQYAGIRAGNVPLESQVAALCWAATDSNFKKNVITAQVSKEQFPKGPAGSVWGGDNRSNVATWCGKLSPGASAQVQKQIAAWQTTGETTTMPPASGEGSANSQKVITTTVK